MTDEDLLEQIAAAPDDAGPYLVYADVLQQRRDPRGDLIVVQHALEITNDSALRRREAELIGEHADRWFGTFDRYVTARMRYGFLHAVRLSGGATADTLAAILALPNVRATLAELRLDSDLEDELPGVLELLARNWPASLRRLHIAAEDRFDLDTGTYSLVPLRRAARLDTLVLGGKRVEIGADPLWANTLRRLECRIAQSAAPQLAAIAWPMLEHLAIDEHGATALPLLSIARFPALRSLALTGVHDTATLCSGLAKHALVEQLAALDLGGGDLTSQAPLAPFLRLELDVRRNVLAEPVARELAERGVRVLPQRESEVALDLVERGDLAGRVERAMVEAGRAIEQEVGVDVRARYDEVVALADRNDCLWRIEQWRLSIAPRLGYSHARSELAAIAADRARTLPEDPLSIAEVLYELGDSFAVTWLWRAVADARVHHATGREGLALQLLGELEHDCSNLAAAESHVRLALDRARAAGIRSAEGRALSELAAISRDRGDLGAAEHMLREAIEVRSGEPLEVADNQHELATLLLDTYRLQEAHGAARAALDCFRQYDDLVGAALAQGLIGEILRSYGDMIGARRWLDASLADCRAARRLDGERTALVFLARISNDVGHHGAARAHAQQATAIPDALPREEGLPHLALADAALGDRQYGDAIQHADDAIALCRESGNRFCAARARMRKGIAAQLQRNDRDAQRHYEEAITEAASHDEVIAWLELWLATLHGRAYRAQQATDLLASATARFPTMTQRTKQALVMAQALIANHGGDVGGVHANVPGYVMASALIDKVKGHRTPLPQPTTFETRLLVRLGDA